MPLQFPCSACGRTVKAPESAVGKKVKCPYCQGVLVVPSAMVEAEETPAAVPPREESFAFSSPSEPLAPETGGDRKPCPMCGELILRDAVKCRFCGEIFDETLRKEQAKKSGAPGDAEMSTGDWVAAVLCSGIGCIAGIIWMIQGKPKGTKMFFVSLGFFIFWTAIRFMLEMAAH